MMMVMKAKKNDVGNKADDNLDVVKMMFVKMMMINLLMKK
jgi:hypothetical protein